MTTDEYNALIGGLIYFTCVVALMALALIRDYYRPFIN